MISKKLQAAGLSKKEADIYLALLELSEATIAQLVKKTGIKRSTVYETIELLKRRGLVSQGRLKKRTVFYAESPKKIPEALEAKKQSIEEAMPELLSLMNLLDKKPKIKYFEGLEGVKEVFEDTLQYPDQEILTLFPYPYINLSEDYFEGYYLPERVKRKIWARAIVPDTAANREFSKHQRENAITTTKFVSDAAFKIFDIEIKIYGDNKVGIISYKEDLGLIIESKKIYDGLKAIFETMWNLLK
ncbi:MAG: transcriptional regulator, TrmB [uncultured bacterium]|uniref:Transcriptional regulator, TrmB n=1 Tax=Candidatus Wolfebacteria bacterium GW2011_GWE2_44_13 TaxID=1619017 RepID=A0A0G1H743_9BACT|nr:MAG: transcriptional regulator, TrmB [uncultured bacterium]KKT43191.1 MAG: Transcriptional regulator, TrmB [Candidatus Wolfebacteria bacterium GW2011_GWE2_44_13]